MEDAYRDIGRLYLALLSPEQVRGDRLGDDAMNRWMRDVPPGASVLDACCGIGTDVLALHRGIPMAGNGGPWTAYGSDPGAMHEIIRPVEPACTRHSRRPACDGPAC